MTTARCCDCADRVTMLRAAVAAQADYIDCLEAQIVKEKEPLPTVAHVIAELRSEAVMLERRVDGCMNVACLEHGEDVQRLLDIDRHLRWIHRQLGEER